MLMARRGADGITASHWIGRQFGATGLPAPILGNRPISALVESFQWLMHRTDFG